MINTFRTGTLEFMYLHYERWIDEIFFLVEELGSIKKALEGFLTIRHQLQHTVQPFETNNFPLSFTIGLLYVYLYIYNSCNIHMYVRKIYIDINNEEYCLKH